MPDFTREYQEHAIGRMLQSSEFMEKTAAIIEPDWFDSEYQPIVDSILKVWFKDQKLLNSRQASQILKGVRFPDTRKSGLSFDLDEIRRFGYHQRMTKLMLETSSMLQMGNYEGAEEKIRESLNASNVNDTDDTQVIDLLTTKLTRDEERIDLFPTGIPSLDKAMGGGVGRKEVALVIAPSNGGKTSWLVNVACNGLMNGLSVLHVSLEMNKGPMRAKYLARLNELVRHKKGRKKKNPFEDVVLKFLEGRPYTMTAQTISKAISRMNSTPDMVIIDYGDLLRAPRMRGQSWEEEKEIYVGIENIARDHNTRVWTAAQAQRPAYGKQDSVIDQQHVAGSITKCQIVDHVFSINQNESEMLPDPETGTVLARIFHAKERFGPKGWIARTTVNFRECTFIEEEFGY